MKRHGRRFSAVALLVAAMLVLAACGAGGKVGAGGAGPEGAPVAGGTLKVLEFSEPRTLDPAALQNTGQGTALLGNALYGTLMIDNQQTGEVEYRMATDFSSTDGGKTFTLELKDGLKFSDGSTLDAAAVKFNWDRLKDPTLGSDSQPVAGLVKSSTVVDPTTLTVTLGQPSPYFAQQMLGSAMNWIASPAALQKGTNAFDQNPIGAGPFTLQSWTRSGSIQLVKNPGYWDAPRPYLDNITITTSADAQQRVNALTTGQVDLGTEVDWQAAAKDKAAGLQIVTRPFGGGQFLALNTLRAPFDDVRARQALSYAIDLDALNAAVYSGYGEVANQLFPAGSKFHNDVALHTYDKAKAQQLFDQLAAEGKPVSFTFTAFPKDRAVAEAVQAQLSAFQNVKVQVKSADTAESGKIFGAHDFDVLVATAFFIDPEPALYSAFSSQSPRNATGINDPRLDQALLAGRTGTSTDQRKAAYQTVSERLAATVPVIFYARPAQAAVASSKVGGVSMYGTGSVLPELLWLAK
ncbi:ABC transporter substrate-binding protein [Amycolatopsis acidicola]|uniref:ABC transporter substrate-binding protein n=1 Tax=Amycolatopsis acidicola TaxID=2596893 RepID=A0A5N0V303_9PSEU|nr:ABC transporter substrate-binding protein [Amycolatopsis acidicola]KAA9159077.1 ABC transporter substrate-binding protein [Amycolatopsis acidicola]